MRIAKTTNFIFRVAKQEKEKYNYWKEKHKKGAKKEIFYISKDLLFMMPNRRRKVCKSGSDLKRTEFAASQLEVVFKSGSGEPPPHWSESGTKSCSGT